MSQNCLIYFFVDSEGQIHINHLNNTAEELREFYGYRNDYPLVLFAYCYKSRRLFVLNMNDTSLKKVLEALRDSRRGSSAPSPDKDAIKQIEAASSFLKNKYAWKGEIFSRDDMESSVIRKEVSDFGLAWKYLSLIFGGLKLDPIDVPVYIVDNLEKSSLFVPIKETLDIGEEVEGPAIILRKTNSKYFMSEALIYQYIMNLHGIVEFSPKVEETYLQDAKEFVDRTLISFLRNGKLTNHTYWYVGKKDGRLYLNENVDELGTFDLMDSEQYSTLLTFEYFVVEDSRYVVFNDVSPADINTGKLYKSMLEFLLENLAYIGHTDERGDVLKDPPIFLFEGLLKDVSFFRASNLPVWIIIQSVLSVMYEFDPLDITIIRGPFGGSFSFKYLDPESWSHQRILREYFDDEGDYPVILWNTSSHDSSIAKWNQFLREYADFVFANYAVEKNGDLKEKLITFRDKVIRNGQRRFALEILIGLLCEEEPHSHQYNIFTIFTDFVGLTGVIAEEELDNFPGEPDIEIMELISDIQSSLYFLTLKSMASFASIKHGIDFQMDGDIQKGDVVTDDHCHCLFEVEAVLLEPANQTDANPEGITYCCRNLICGKQVMKTLEDVKLFHLGFLDDEEYNEKQASSLRKKSQQFGAEYYKKMLEQFLRTKRRPNPLDFIEEKVDDPPSFDAFLAMQREDFNRTEGDMILENMLNDCRKVKSYGD